MLNYHYYLLAEWACFVAAFLLLPNNGNLWPALLSYIFFISVIESLAYCWVLFPGNTSNQAIYNIEILFEFGFGIWICFKMINFRFIKVIALSAYGLFYSGYIIGMLRQGGLSNYLNLVNVLGSVIMIGFCMIYFYTLFQQEGYLNLLKDSTFWFFTGYFIFYTSGISVDTFFDELVNKKIVPHLSVRLLIMNILNFVLYGCWIKSFLCLKKTETKILTLQS